jgi:hypothetical protein
MKSKCPTCGGPVPSTTEAFPFCSPRCRLVDLGRWLGEEYRIPAVEAEEETAAAPSGPEPPPPAPSSPLRN